MAASGSAPDPKPAPSENEASLLRLTKRRDFLSAARARKWASKGFVLQARRRAAEERFVSPEAVRVGFTASKKVGGAVVRNRAKRRLRALAAAHLPALARPGWDYVLIARAEETVSRPFAALEAELIEAMRKIHAPKKSGGRNSGDDRKTKADAPRPEPEPGS